MFEKYHLIHFDINRPISKGDVFDHRLSLPQEANDPLFVQEFKRSLKGLPTHGKEEFSLTGSFDFLMPSIYEGDTDNNFIYLENFCILNCTKGYQTIREDFASYLISYTLSGEGVLHYKNQTYQLTPNTGFIIDCREAHEYYTKNDTWQHIDMHINGSPLQTLYREFSDTDICVFSISEPNYIDLLEQVLHAYTTISTHRKVHVYSTITNLLNSILYAVEQTDEHDIPDTYKYLLRYMESNYSTPLSLEELAEFACTSKYHMSREFKKYTGYSPIEYLNRLRMQHAGLLLTQTDMTIESICLEVGIENPSNFSYLFKKNTGMTPSAFRKK